MWTMIEASQVGLRADDKADTRTTLALKRAGSNQRRLLRRSYANRSEKQTSSNGSHGRDARHGNLQNVFQFE
jgi:hypothetical protein